MLFFLKNILNSTSLICIFYTVLLVFSHSSNARPWCNSERLNITERSICNNNELRKLDTQLEKIYGTAQVNNKDYGQLDWLKNRRNTCKDNIDCITREYQSRIAILMERISVTDALNSRPWCSATRLNLTESTICFTTKLRDLDAELQVVYGQARTRKEDSGQLYWLRKERNTCGSDKECITTAYQSRISILRNRMQKYQIVEITNRTSVQDTVEHGYEITRRCSGTQLNELKAVCMITAVGEHACSSALSDELPRGVLSNIGANGVCSAAAAHLIDGSIDPSILGLSMASGFLNGVGDSLLDSDDSFSAFVGVLFKMGSLAMSAASVDECFNNAEQICR